MQGCTSRASWLGGLMLGVALAGAWPSAAAAKTYTVTACGNGVNNAWTFSSGVTTSNTARSRRILACPPASTADGIGVAMSPYDPGGGSSLLSRGRAVAVSASTEPSRGGSSWGQWLFRAPPGATVKSFAGTWSCSASSTFLYGIETASTQATRNCAAGGFSTVSLQVPSGSTWVALYLECLSFGAVCGPAQSPRVALGTATVTVDDPTSPAVTVTGGTLTEGVAASIATAKFVATDNTGIRRAWLTVDGAARPARSYPCDYTRPAPCSNNHDGVLELDTNAFANGSQHSFTVTVEDAAGNTATSPSRSFVADNRIVHAQGVTGDPAAGLTLVAEEWVIPRSTTVRRENSDSVTTRDPVPCAAADGGAWCAETRWRTLDSQLDGATPEDLDTYSVHTGATLLDPNVPLIGDLTGPAAYAALGMTPIATGALSSVLEPWQVPPPRHGSTYALYEVPRQVAVNAGSADPATGEYPDGTEMRSAVLRVWVDAATGLPVRQTFAATGASTADLLYYTYDPALSARADHPADFFSVSPPEEASLLQAVTYEGDVSTPRASTGRDALRFEAVDLGPTATVGGRPYCLVTTRSFTQAERARGEGAPPAGLDLSVVDRVDAVYAPRRRGGACRPGLGAAADAALTITSTSRSSGLGYAYRNAVMAAGRKFAPALRPSSPFDAPSPMGRRPDTAFTAPALGGGSLAVADFGSTTVLARGRFTPGEAETLVSDLRRR
jgi:hypothetical protein